MSSTTNVIRFDHEKDVTVFKAKETIFTAGETAEVMYAVVEGQVEIIKGGTVLEIIEPGGIFGEMALIDKQPRSADAVARADCRLAVINPKRFLFLIQQTPFFALEVMRVMATRLRRTTAKVTSG